MSPRFRVLCLSALLIALASFVIGAALPVQGQWSSGDYPINAFALSRDGTRMAVTGRAIDSAETSDGEYYPIDIYDVATGKLVDTLNPIWPLTSAIALNFDGTLLAYTTTTGVQVTEVGTRKRLYSLETQTRDYVGRFVWSPVNSQLLVLMQSGKTYLFDARKPDPALELQNLAQTNAIKDADWNGDGAEIALLTTDQTMRIWDPSAGKVTRSFQCSCTGELAWQPNGRAIAVTNDALVRLVNAITGNTIASIQDDHQYDLPLSIAWSQDGKRIAVGTYYGGLLVYDSDLKTIAASHSVEAKSVFWNADGDVFTRSGNRIYKNAEPVTLDMSAIQIPQVAHVHQIVSDPILGMGISHDGATLAVSGRSLWYGNFCGGLSPIDLFSTKTGLLLNTIENAPGVPVQITFSPNDRQIAYGDDGFDSSLGVIDLASEQVLFEQSNCMAPNRITRASWSTDGIRAALADAYGMDIFDTKQLKTIAHIDALPSDPQSEDDEKFIALDWLPDFDWIVTATDRTIQVWDLTKTIEKPGVIYAPFPSGIKAIAANPVEPSLFAAGAEHGVIFLYNILDDIYGRSTGGYLQVSDTGAVYQLAWSPNGKHLAVAAPDQVAVLDYESKTVLLTYRPSEDVISLAWSGNNDLFFATTHGIYKNGKPFSLRNQAGEFTSPPTLAPSPSPVPTYAVEEEWEKGKG